MISNKVVFLVDISGSMLMYDEGGEGGKSSSWERRQRIARAKRQLGKVIQKLSGHSFFNIIAFNDRVSVFQKRMVLAKSSVKKKALRFIQNLDADRGTDTGLALETAFRDPRLDTIVLLTDGAPHTPAGKPDQLIPIVENRLRDLNRLRRVRIFTFGFHGRGKWPPGSKYQGQARDYVPQELEGFLERLAENHSGKYTRLD